MPPEKPCGQLYIHIPPPFLFAMLQPAERCCRGICPISLVKKGSVMMGQVSEQSHACTGWEPVSIGNVDILFIIDFFGINSDFKKTTFIYYLSLYWSAPVA